MIVGMRQCGVLALAGILGTLFPVRAEDDSVDWQGKYRALEARAIELEAELYDLKYHNRDLRTLLLDKDVFPPNFCSRFNVRDADVVDFQEVSLHEIVREMNRHLQTAGTIETENAIGLRRKRIRALESEIEQLRETDKIEPIREVRIELPKEAPSPPITFSAMRISFKELVTIVAQISGVAYQVDDDKVTFVPIPYHRPIPRDGLDRKAIIPSLNPDEHSVSVFFTEAGLKQALEEGWVDMEKDEFVNPFDGHSDDKPLVPVLSTSGEHRFSHLLFPNRIDDQVRTDAWKGPGSRRWSGLHGTPVVGGLRLLRATTEEASSGSLSFKDHETQEPVRIDWERTVVSVHDDDGNYSNGWVSEGKWQPLGSYQFGGLWDFSIPLPSLKPGFYVYYSVGIREMRPEDRTYFHEPVYLRMLFEHESGYYVRFPEYLQSHEPVNE